MTKEDTIRMAREANLTTAWIGAARVLSWKDIEHFAAIVAASEREACAKVCDRIDAEYDGEDVLATWCSEAIRARGN